MKRCKPICGAGVVPSPAPYQEACACKPDKITLRTVVIPANLGTDAEGSAYAPKAGAYYNTIVVYQATGAVYVYDSNGVYTQVENGGYEELVQTVNGFASQMDELYDPDPIGLTVKTYAELETYGPEALPLNTVALVEADETHKDEASLYYYNPSTASWTYLKQASPYYTKAHVDTIENALEQEIANREAADTTLQDSLDTLDQRVTDMQNSPDVRFIEPTYAALEELDKTGIGDKDYARVLQDENHQGASTYYQFNLADQTWEYVGEVGSYYTKEQIDAMIGQAVTQLEAI